MPLTGSFTGTFRNLNELYRQFDSVSSLSGAFVESALSSLLEATPKVNYAHFNEHTFFDDAVYKTQAALLKINNEYPIGLSGGSVDSLTAHDVLNANKFINEATPFENYVLKYLGGVTGWDYNLDPSITASANAEGQTYSLIVVYRNTNNSISGQQTTLSANLLNIAKHYEDDRMSRIFQRPGTADHNITWTSSGFTFTSEVTPSEYSIDANRDMKLANMLPESYFYDDESDLLKQYVAVWGRAFDEIKVYIDEFSNLTTISYDKFHKVPDGYFQMLLAKQQGIDLIETAINEKLSRYLQSQNYKIKSYEVSNLIFDRILNNLIYILKYKGTKEALESIIRIFGLPTNYLSIKDYRYFQEQRQRIRVDFVNTKVLSTSSVNGAISFTGSPTAGWAFLDTPSGQCFTVEARVSVTGQGTQSSSGTILSFGNSNSGWDVSYKNGIFKFRMNNVVASTTESSSATVMDAISSNYLSIFAIASANTAQIKAYWIDTDSGSACLSSVSGSATCFTGMTVTGGPLSAYICNTLSGGNNTLLNNGFVGYIQEVKGFSTVLNVNDIEEHVRNFESISYANSPITYAPIVRFQYKLKENKTLAGSNNYILDSSGNNYTGYAINALSSVNPYSTAQLLRKETRLTAFGNFVDDNVDFAINDVSRENIRNTSSRAVSISLNPIDAVNNDIQNILGNVNLANLISDPRNFYDSPSAFKTYQTLQNSGTAVFPRYNSTKLNINAYIKAVENFAFVLNGIINLAQQFIPARSRLISKGVVIEPHLLNRPRDRRVDVSSTSEIYYAPLSAFEYILLDYISVSSKLLSETDFCGNLRAITMPLTSSHYLNSATQLKDIDMKCDTSTYFNITGSRDIIISNSAYGHAINNVYVISNDDILYPYYQEVASKPDTSILFTTNRNIIETSSTLSSDINRAAITGNAKLIRTSTGKIITSQEKTMTVDIPTQDSALVLAITANNSPITSSSKTFTIASKTGIDFIIRSVNNDVTLGIQNLRILNLLSGNSLGYPIILLPTSGHTSALGGGQTLVKVGKAEI